MGCGSFGGIRCKSKAHLSPAGVTACTSCGSSDLSSYAPSINLRPFTRIAAWGIAIVMLRLLFFHAPQAVGAAETVGGWSLLHLFGIDPDDVRRVVDRILTWIMVFLLFSWVLPKPYGSALRSYAATAIRLFLRYAWIAAVYVARLLFRAIDGAKP